VGRSRHLIERLWVRISSHPNIEIEMDRNGVYLGHSIFFKERIDLMPGLISEHNQGSI